MPPSIFVALATVVIYILQSEPTLRLIDNPDELIEGRAVIDWPVLWVEQKFAESTKLANKRNGRCGYQMQPGVWAISIARPEKAHEVVECRIPLNQILFVEAISSTVLSTEVDGSCQRKYEVARKIVGEVIAPEIEYDGTLITNLAPFRRAMLDCPDPHRFANREKRFFPTSGADGYFLMFRLAGHNQHKISLVASHECWFDQQQFGCPHTATRRRVDVVIVAE